MAASAPAAADRQRSILARLLAIAAPGEPEALASALLAEFGTISRLLAQTPEAVERVAGAGTGAAPLLAAARAAVIEAQNEELRPRPIDPFSPELRRYLIGTMASLPHEALRVLFLDAAGMLIADEELQQGSLGNLAIHPRVIFRRALELGAAGLILAHNHPSGDPRPSADDVRATQRLDQIGRSLEIEIVDHVVVTAGRIHHIVRDRCAAPLAGRESLTLRSPGDPEMEEALANIQSLIRRRLLRRQLIGAQELFGEPAWEMLLDVFVHEAQGKDLAITSMCMTAGLPLTSALRLASRLCDAGILRRIPDPVDGRRSFVKLNPSVKQTLIAYFSDQ